MAKNSTRLVSLDIFRGLTLAFMIVVNTPGSWNFVYAPLRHAKWHGCTPTDLVFPFFLFIVGVSMWFSMKKYGHEINTGSILRIVRRTLAIFALGLFLTIFPKFIDRDYSALRIMGVLQRIALAYFFGSILALTVKRNYLWIAIAIILLAYWAILGIFGGSDPFSLEGNLASKVDALILGKSHLYKGFGIPFDPEGLLSTLPAIGTVLIGFYVGEIIGNGEADTKTVLKLVLFGLAATGLGILWGLFFPINKPLWTSSYVLYTAGLAMLVLSLIYLIADVGKLQKWGMPLMVFGTNTIFSYFLAGVWTKTMLYIIKIPSGDTTITFYNWFYQKVCVPVAGDINGSLLFALIQVMIIWGISYILYRKKVFIRL